MKSQTCQATAWSHHHKIECKAIIAMKGWGFGNMILDSTLGGKVRLFVRLLVLRDNDKISDSEWA
jgi:hypothetical protein